MPEAQDAPPHPDQDFELGGVAGELAEQQRTKQGSHIHAVVLGRWRNGWLYFLPSLSPFARDVAVETKFVPGGRAQQKENVVGEKQATDEQSMPGGVPVVLFDGEGAPATRTQRADDVRQVDIAQFSLRRPPQQVGDRKEANVGPEQQGVEQGQNAQQRTNGQQSGLAWRAGLSRCDRSGCGVYLRRGAGLAQQMGQRRVCPVEHHPRGGVLFTDGEQQVYPGKGVPHFRDGGEELLPVERPPKAIAVNRQHILQAGLLRKAD